jgi:enoyl-CoA hydratase
MSTQPNPTPKVVSWREQDIWLMQINRAEVRNCVDGPTAALLADACREFESDPALKVAILTGSGDHFCAGADLKAIASGDVSRMNRLQTTGDGPMGPSRLLLSKPVIAAIEGYCVAGGLELAAWCDLRVADSSARFGVFCRRFGVPLIDGGTVRLPRLIGLSHALDLILTGREIDAEEAFRIGLVNRLCPAGDALESARRLARELAALPQQCLRHDRMSALLQAGLSEQAALEQEFQFGMRTLQSGETVLGAGRFVSDQGQKKKPNPNRLLRFD